MAIIFLVWLPATDDIHTTFCMYGFLWLLITSKLYVENTEMYDFLSFGKDRSELKHRMYNMHAYGNPNHCWLITYWHSIMLTLEFTKYVRIHCKLWSTPYSVWQCCQMCRLAFWGMCWIFLSLSVYRRKKLNWWKFKTTTTTTEESSVMYPSASLLFIYLFGFANVFIYPFFWLFS